MRLAVAVTSDVIGRPSGFGWTASHDVMVDAADRAGVEPM
jgi:hypothetical protein